MVNLTVARFSRNQPNIQRVCSSAASADTPACLMVFQDGPGYAKEDGAFKVPALFDELIQAKQMPVTVAVFVSPGTIEADRRKPPKVAARVRLNMIRWRSLRAILGGQFLPVALAGVNVSDDPAKRAIGGISSGGICAFTAAWERPDQFGKK
ncbi:MAG: alpha/beta hydrolase-fold protein [Pirellulaceae bacterium]